MTTAAVLAMVTHHNSTHTFMSEQIYDVNFFINFFGAIPEDRDKWCGGMWFDGNSGYCALGHCGVAFSDDIDKLPVATALVALFGGNISNVTRVSDGDDPRYQQPTPKARILAALHDIKRQQEQAAEAFELRPLSLTKPERKETIEAIA